MVVAIIMFAVAGVNLIIGFLHFFERGPLMNNAYLYASKQQRKSMNKKPYYRQSAIVFFLLSVIFIIVGLSVVMEDYRITFLEFPVMTGIVIYAIVSSMRINKKEKR